MRTEQREEECLERRLRGQYEALYKQKCQHYCSMLESRYETLKEAIETVYKHIMADQVLAAMLNDRTTSAHVHERIKEVFSETITHEREIIFKKLGTQITNLKFQNEQLQREVDRLKDSQQCLQKNFTTERQTLEKTSNSASEELKRTKQEVSRTKQEFKKMKDELNQYHNKYEKLCEENNQLHNLVESMKEQHELTAREQEEMGQYKYKLRQAETSVEELKALLKDAQEKAERRYQAKRKEYKQKIDSYKSIITQMNNQRLQTEEAVRRQEGQHASLHMERKIASLLKDHERKINELRQAKEKEKVELIRMHELHLKERQIYFQKLLEQKVQEIQENAARYFERMKEELSDENYLPRSTCQEEIGKRDEIMMLMKNKLEQFESMCEDYHSRNEALTSRLKESETVIGIVKQKNSQLQQSNQQIIAKLKSYEQANNIFKLGDQKNKDQFAQYERLLKKAKDENEDAKQTIIKLEHDRNQNDVQIREKQRKIKDTIQENEILIKKMKKLSEAQQDEVRRCDSLTITIGELKKEMASLQYKLKDKEMTAALNSTSWENKHSALQVELKEKNKLLADLQDKYQQMSSSYQEEKRKNYEIDNTIKRYEMENKFYKETTDLQRGESQTVIEQYKRTIADKNDKLVLLQAQLDKKCEKVSELENDLKQQKERSITEGKKTSLKIKKLNKIITNQLQNLRKESMSIVHYLKTRATIFQNDDSILRSTFNKQLVHMHILNDRDKDIIIRNTKTEIAEALNAQAKALKSEYEDKLKEIQEKNEGEKNAMRIVIKERQGRLEEMGREHKRLIIELKKASEETSQLEKQLESAVRRGEKEKEGLEGKLQDLLREMKEERDVIVKQYEDKKYASEQQIQNLATSLKRLRAEAEAIQNKHQEEKAAINGQLRTIREQQEVIHRVSQQKDQEIQRIAKDYEASLETKRQLQNQNRSYADALNKKVQALHELEIKEHQITGELNLLKNKCERISEENSELRRKIAQREEEFEESVRSKARFESELKDIKGALSRSTKNQELRALNELSMETLQLSQKVNQMRKVSNYLDGKTPLRS